MRSTCPGTIPRYSLGVSGPRVLLVVPTLGRRPEHLEQNLASIRSQSVPADIVIVAPSDSAVAASAARRFDAELLPDPGSLPGAINAGAATAQSHHEYVNWLGDDDLLEPGSLEATTAALDAHPEAVLVFGHCRYIDEHGRELWISRAGRWAPSVLAWGPDLIPQPGMLVRTNIWQRVSGLDETYRFAFDLDLLLRLRKHGRLLPIDRVVAAFRWHGDSLTVGDRATNIAESERAKRAALSPGARRVAWIWEPPVRVATRIAAQEVSRRARRRSV